MKKYLFLLMISPAYALPLPELTSAVFGLGEIFLIFATAITLYFPFLKKFKSSHLILYLILALSVGFNIYYFLGENFARDLPIETRPGMVVDQADRDKDPYAIDEIEAYKLRYKLDKYVFIDARSQSETELGTAQGFTKIRWPDIVEQKDKLQGRTVIATCWTGMRGSEVCSKLRQHGIDCFYLREGLKGWIAKNLPIVLSLGVTKDIFGTSEPYENSEKILTPRQTLNATEGGAVIIDTRTPEEFNKKSIKGSVNIPFNELSTAEMEYRIKSLIAQNVIVACYGAASCSEASGWGWEMHRIGHTYLGAYSGGIEAYEKISTPDVSYLKPLEHIFPIEISFLICAILLGFVLRITRNLAIQYFFEFKERKEKLKILKTKYQDDEWAMRRENHSKADIYSILKSFMVLALAIFYTWLIKQINMAWGKDNLLSYNCPYLIWVLAALIAFNLNRIIFKKVDFSFFAGFLVLLIGVLKLVGYFSPITVLVLVLSLIVSMCVDMIITIKNYGVLNLDRAWKFITPNTKAYRLSWLKSKGFNVPDGFILKEGMKVPKMSGALAVRSSAVGEDSSSESHAGLYLSVVPSSKNTYLQDIKAVFNSYKNKNEIVLLQKLVAPQFSGVAFSHHPSWGGVSLIEWGEGLSGKRLDGSENSRQAVIERATHQLVLGDFEYYREVYDLVKKVEAQYSTAMDIEWAIDKNGRLWLLQARPQTALEYNYTEQDRNLVLSHGFKSLETCELSWATSTRLSSSLVASLWKSGDAADLASRMALYRWRGISYHYIFNRLWAGDNNLVKPNKISWLMAKKNFKNNLLEIESRKIQLIAQKNINLAISWNKLEKEEWMDLFNLSVSNWKEMQKFSLYFEFMAQSAINDCKRYKDFRDDFLAGTFFPTDIGYRSDIDYELSCPRYLENGTGIIPQIRTHHKDISNNTLRDKVAFANKMIYLRDEYKHYSLSLYYILRLAVLDLNKRFVQSCYDVNYNDIADLFEGKNFSKEIIYDLPDNMTPRDVALMGRQNITRIEKSHNKQGKFVSCPSKIEGNLIILKENINSLELEEVLKNNPNAIIYSRAISPHMVEIASRYQVNAICSLYGSTLSHPAILAREAKIPFIIKVDLTDLKGKIKILANGIVEKS